MSAHRIDGKTHAARLRERVADAAAVFRAECGRPVGLAVVLVGEDPASQIYVRAKGHATVEAGMASFEHRLAADVSQDALLARVALLNSDPLVDGILVQLPLPGHLNEAAVIEAIDPAKDVDGFHVANAGRLAVGRPGLVPCTPLGCLMLLKDRLGALAGLEAVVLGRSNIVGKPMAQLLLAEHCTVTLAHSRTRQLPQVVRRADIVVVAIGQPQAVRADWLKPGCTVIDVGINRVPGPTPGSTRLVGDVDFEAACAVAGAITPVPGGVGPMTIAVLLRNAVAAACARMGVPLELEFTA